MIRSFKFFKDITTRAWESLSLYNGGVLTGPVGFTLDNCLVRAFSSGANTTIDATIWSSHSQVMVFSTVDAYIKKNATFSAAPTDNTLTASVIPIPAQIWTPIQKGNLTSWNIWGIAASGTLYVIGM